MCYLRLLISYTNIHISSIVKEVFYSNMLNYKNKKLTENKSKSYSKYTLSTRIWPYIFVAPFAIFYMIFSLFPILYSFYISLFDWNGISDKVFIGIKNYIRIFTKDPLFYKSVWNTILMMLMSTPITLILGMILAFALFNMTRGKKFFQTANFLPYITTPVAIGFIFSYLFDWSSGYINLVLIKLGIIHQGIYWLQDPWTARMVVAIMIIWRYLGYFMTIYLAGLTAIPDEIYEAAKVDGASIIKIFFKITIPMLKNITVFLIVTSVIGGLQMFDEPVMLYSGWGAANVGGPDHAVLTVVWKFFDDAFRTNSYLGYGAAISYSLFVIIVVCSLISYKLSARSDEN